MGLIQLFTNPAGFLKDKVQDKVKSRISDFKSINPLEDLKKSSQGIRDIGDRISGKASASQDLINEIMGGAIGGGEARKALMERVKGISERDLPEVDFEGNKRAGKLAQISNRIGAGLFAASGGDPRAITAGFRAKEEAKSARLQRQREVRQAAIESQDDDMVAALSNIDERETAARTAFGGDFIQQQTILQQKGIDAQKAAFEQEAENARQVLDIQASFEEQRQGHIDRIGELDVQGQLNLTQIEHAAAIQMRNDMNSELMSFGMNPAGLEETVNAYSRGDFGSLTAQDHVRLSLVAKMRAARTDEELRMAKIGTLAQVLNTRVHARDENTGAFMYTLDGDPVFTTLSTPEAGASWIFGSKQDALDALRSNALSAETESVKRFVTQAGMVDPSPMTQLGSSAFEKGTQGFPGTRDNSFNDVDENPQDAREQLRRSADIWNKAAGYLDAGNSMRDVVSSLKNQGASSEIIQMTMQRAMEFGYWDGEEDKDAINQIITIGAAQNPAGGIQ